jgi:hypothetical protein
MRLPPTQAGGQVLGNTLTDGAYMVLAGPARGQLHLLYQNSEVNDQFVTYFAKCLCAHICQYLCKEKNVTCRCCQAIIGYWFEAKEGLRAMDLAGIRPCIEQLLFSVFLTKPMYKIWLSWA